MKVSSEQFKWIKNEIFKRLLKYGAWENKYVPYQKTLFPIPGHLKGLAKQVLKQLVKDGFLLFHKNASCVSLNSRRMSEICYYTKQFKMGDV